MLKIILRLCLIVSTLLLSACMPNIKSDTPTPANQTHSHSDISGAEALSGNWDGLIQTGLDFTYIRLELDKINSAANASEQSYSGTAYAQSFADYLAKRSLKNDIQAQSTPINIKFDTRTNTFSIQVERGTRPRNQRMSTAFPIHELSGIYSQADRALAGLTGSRGFAGKSAVGGQYFLFTRPDQFDKVTDTLKPYVGNFISKKSGLFEMFTAPDKNAINKWAQQLYDEYPQMDLYNMAHGVFELYCIKLMRDDHFEKHFGTRFDELIKLKLDGFNSALNKLKSSRDRQERSTGVMERMFWVGPGDNSAKQSLFWVKAHRFFINWRKEQLARLGSMPISTGSQAYTDAFETEMKKYAETVFWPSEVKADTQALVALRGSIAKLQELEKEKLYVSYNKALLDDLAADIKSSTKSFEQMVELSKFDDRARNKLRQHGRELQSYTGPSSDTQRKAAEMISAAINPNIVSAAAEFAKNQHGASSISNNLSPIGSGPFSHLAKYITDENRQAIDQIFYKATFDLVREIVDAESANTKNIVDSNQSDFDKLQLLASQRNEFEKKYDRKILNDSLMLTYLSDHKQQRLKLLNAVEPQVIASIEAANSVNDIKFNLPKYVAQEDQNAEVVRRIENAQAAQLKKLTAFRPVASESELDIRSFNTKGLNYETELTAIYLGDFQNSRLERDGMAVSIMFSDYLRAYGGYCGEYLPRNKVPITTSRCAREWVTKNGYGMEISRNCIEWVDEPTGLYADPELYNSSNQLSTLAGSKVVSEAFKGDMFATRAVVDDKLSMGNDMKNLILNNQCNNAGLKRFEANLYRFVEGKPPLLLPGKETLSSVKSVTRPDLKAGNLDLNKLLDDLIAENAKGWMLNRYNRGSVKGVNVQSRNSNGSPSKVNASYDFTTMGKKLNGTVLLTFSNDIPDCLYFSDAPQTCRHPSKRVINVYEKGGYLN